MHPSWNNGFGDCDDYQNLSCYSVFFAYCLPISASAIYDPRVAVGQVLGTPSQSPQETPAANLPTPNEDSEGSQPSSSQPTICGPAHLGQCLKDVVKDQGGFWTSPLHVQPRDLIWLVPFAGATGAAIHYDARAQQELGIGQRRIDTSNTISRFGSTYATVTEGAALYVIGRLKHDEHLSETGRLGVEAVIDASLVAEAIKLATNRQRRDEGDSTGRFWPHGASTFSGCFPSGHAIGSSALARVIASEYPNKMTQIGVYAFATAISVSRVTSRQHFPSDVLVGSVFGYLIGVM
jgi:hypothetical protein